MEKIKFVSKDKIKQLPKSTGVYAFKKGAELLYIGKATNIRERVKQHEEVLGLARHIGYIKTNSEIEALILEANLIKKYQPKYNVVWKDDKNYFYVVITKEEFPRVSITHQPKLAEVCPLPIGPFVEGRALKKTLDFLRKVFPYYTTKKHPKGSCLWCSLKLCPGPNPDKKEYQKNIKKLISILQGKSKNVLRNLRKEMKIASQSRNFERAAKIRDQILALEKVMSHSRIFEDIEVGRIEAYDVSNIQGKEATGAMVVFINGKPDKSQYRKFKIKIQGKPNDVAMLKEILQRRFNHPEWPYPDLILIDGGKAQLNAILSITRNLNFLRRVGFPPQRDKARRKFRFRIVSLAKKKNELFIEGQKKPTLLKTLPREIFNLILQLRDEAHRFARKYHLKLREIDLFSKC